MFHAHAGVFVRDCRRSCDKSMTRIMVGVQPPLGLKAVDPSLQPLHVTDLIPDLADFNTEDGSSVLR
jgi:hypothetical protein